MQVVLSLTDAATKPSQRTELTKVWKPDDQGSVFERLVQPARAGLGKALQFGGKALKKGGEVLRDPALVATIAKESGEITRELAVALSLADDPPTAFKGALGGTKRCAWAEPLPLEEDDRQDARLHRQRRAARLRQRRDAQLPALDR
jgi:hypothetical protein